MVPFKKMQGVGGERKERKKTDVIHFATPHPKKKKLVYAGLGYFAELHHEKILLLTLPPLAEAAA